MLDFIEIYRKNAGLVFFSLKKMGVNPEDCEDLVQEVFSRFFERQSKIDQDKIASFLLITAKNLVIDRYRKSQTQKTESVGETVESAERPLWESDRERDLKIQALDEIFDEIEQQPGGDWFCAHYREGLKLREIAEQHDQPLPTVAAKIQRLRSRFKNRIRNHIEGQEMYE